MKTLNSLVILCSLCASTAAFAYGEGEDIPSDSRAMHLLVNEARSDIQNALSLCGSNCTEGTETYGKQIGPVWWNDDLHRAAQFHSTMLASVGECLSHVSPCNLKSDLRNCDGSPSCACKEGTASCSGTGTDTFDRIKKFAKDASGEILVNGTLPGEAFSAFYIYLHEDGAETYGHRAIILDPNNKSVGFGDKTDQKGEIWDTGNFGSKATSQSAITAGAYYTATSVWPEYARIGDGNLWFKMHYYATSPLKKATISINNACTELEFVVGNDRNGIYGMVPQTELTECSEYYFEAIDQNGKVTRYPSTGVLLYNCSRSWKASSSKSSCIHRKADESEANAVNVLEDAIKKNEEYRDNPGYDRRGINSDVDENTNEDRFNNRRGYRRNRRDAQSDNDRNSNRQWRRGRGGNRQNDDTEIELLEIAPDETMLNTEKRAPNVTVTQPAATGNKPGKTTAVPGNEESPDDSSTVNTTTTCKKGVCTTRTLVYQNGKLVSDTTSQDK